MMTFFLLSTDELTVGTTTKQDKLVQYAPTPYSQVYSLPILGVFTRVLAIEELPAPERSVTSEMTTK